MFINKPHMTSDDVEGMCCTQAFEVSPGQTQGTPILTKYVNFQFVTSVTLFLDKGEDDELDDEVSAISEAAILRECLGRHEHEGVQEGRMMRLSAPG